MATVVAVGTAYNPTATFTRPADANPYASGDLVANSTLAVSVQPMTFTGTAGTVGSLSITRARIQKSGTNLANAQFRLHLYTSDPSAASGIVNGDNGVWSTGIGGYIGALDMNGAMNYQFSNGAMGEAAPLIGRELTYYFSNGKTLYALLEARAAYTPSNGEVFTVILEAIVS